VFVHGNPGPAADDLHRRLRGLDRPALVVWGERDPYLPVRYAEQQRETFPRAEVLVLSDSGHWPMIDHPAAVEAPVLRSLSVVTGDPALPLSHRGARTSAAGESKLAAIPIVAQGDDEQGAQGNQAH
jgi:hypothetical protein